MFQVMDLLEELPPQKDMGCPGSGFPIGTQGTNNTGSAMESLHKWRGLELPKAAMLSNTLKTLSAQEIVCDNTNDNNETTWNIAKQTW